METRDERKRYYYEQKVLPALDECVAEWERWGVTLERMWHYSNDFWSYRALDNDVYDCAWGCFFLRMGWLDDDIEGLFQAPVMLAHLEKYLEASLETSLKVSRCVYVNYPHAELRTGHVPDCEQAKLLKNCLIKEETLGITHENKLRLVELLRSWLGFCADDEGLPLAEVLARAARPPRPSPPRGQPVPPALQGCAWRCLFYDMGWMNDVDGEFLLPVVNETIRMYYYKTDLIPQLKEESTKCVQTANRFPENDEVMELRPRGCDRSQLYVDCLVNNFFKNLTSPWFTDEERSIRVGSQSSSPTSPRPRSRPPPPQPHLVRTRLSARVAPLPLAPSDSVVVKLKVTETDK
ncbi:uncharacterized protein LOC134668826 [Cydia fagiglandana]|uniref:uncharacterized protein LOC134668826 n=1 Tax=Cydia fagiglandana TaxID=1458189 RepID=UPI002FEE1A69